MIKGLKALTPVCSGPLRLLLLDDQPADAELALLELERAGYQVAPDLTQNLEDFTARLRTNFYDLILSDFNLGQHTGMDAFSTLKLLEKDTPFLLVTGTLGDELAVDCIKQGVTDYVLKDNLVRLPLAVRRALAEHGLRAEQLLAQEALQQSEERYRLLVQASPDAILVNCEGSIVFANPAALRLLGATDPAQVLGRPGLEFVHLDYHQAVRQRMDLAMGKQLPVPALEEKFLRLDGSAVDVEVIAIPSRWKDKRAAQVVARDITERKRAQEAVRKSESRFRRVFETTVMGVIICTLEGAVLDANDAFLNLIGYSRQELEAGQIRWIELTPPEFLHLDRAASEQLRQGHSVAPWEKEYIRKDGTRLPVLIGAAMLEGSQEEAVGFILDISERRRAEEELRHSHALLQGVAEGTSDSIFVKDLQGRYLMANSGCAAALGHTREEVLGKTDAELLDPETARNFAEGDHRALLVGGSQTAEEHHVSRARTYLATKAPWRDGQGKVQGIIGISRDITERKSEQEALRHSEEKFAKAFGSSPTAISISTLREGRYVDVNDRFLQMTGYPRAEILGRSAAELGIWMNPENRVTMVEQLAREGKVLDYEFHFRTKGGEDRSGSLSAEVIQVGGEPCLLATVRDDTERHRAQQALLESKRQYQSLVNSVDGIVWEADADTLRFSFVSQQAERLLGYPAEQWLSEPDFWQNHIHPDDRQKAVELCIQAVAEKRDHAFEYRMVAADKRAVWLRDIVSLVEENGQVVKLRGLMVDITEQREMEQQLRQAQKMEAVGQLAGGVAHDFNNLLMVIRGYCELMLDRLEPQSVVRTQAEGIMQAAQRASGVTRQLLAFSRKQVLQPRVLDLSAVVGDVGKMLLRLIGEDIELQVVKGPDLGRVKADPGQIEQIIVNMAVNARDAMPNGGKLTIETSNVELDNAYVRHHINVQPGSYVLLAVTDNGTGMYAETRSRIFEPFFTTKEQGKGTGLGLATVYGIVKQSGGYIWVYSEPGAGTTFKVYLPRVTEAAQPERVAAVASPQVQASETVLMVEDEEGVRKVVRGFLEARGYRVLEAENGPEALRLAGGQNGPIHLLLTDMVMPVMNGPELAEQIRRQRPEVKVLFMSGYTSRGARQNHGLDAGSPFLEKPFSGEILVRKIREVLDARPSEGTAANH